jgi:hypothetical protein
MVGDHEPGLHNPGEGGNDEDRLHYPYPRPSRAGHDIRLPAKGPGSVALSAGLILLGAALAARAFLEAEPVM